MILLFQLEHKYSVPQIILSRRKLGRTSSLHLQVTLSKLSGQHTKQRCESGMETRCEGFWLEKG